MTAGTDDVNIGDIKLLAAQNARILELARMLREAGIPVPEGVPKVEADALRAIIPPPAGKPAGGAVADASAGALEAARAQIAVLSAECAALRTENAALRARDGAAAGAASAAVCLCARSSRRWHGCVGALEACV